jgi:uncharacterized protein (DUF1778 family)
MPATITRSRQARIDFRTTPEVKSLIERAAAINGKSVSEFISSTVSATSREIIQQNELRVLTDRDRDILLSLLDAPAAPNGALRSAASSFHKAVSDGALIP